MEKERRGAAKNNANALNNMKLFQQPKPFRQLEKLVKGFANHRRIEIIHLLFREPELSVAEISEKLNVNFKTISEHIRRLNHAGLVLKRNEGAAVRHKLTPQAVVILKFLRTLE